MARLNTFREIQDHVNLLVITNTRTVGFNISNRVLFAFYVEHCKIMAICRDKRTKVRPKPTARGYVVQEFFLFYSVARGQSRE